jgi:hypothetical protein
MRGVALTAAMCVVFNPCIAPGCDCGPAGPACAYVSRAAAVFAGTVVFTDDDPAMGLAQRTLVKFKVDESFKGLAPGDREVWVDPGSFTSCYAEYHVGEHLLVFAYEGRRMPPDTAVMSVVPGQSKAKPIPADIDRNHPPFVYSAPECSGTRLIRVNDPELNRDMYYLQQFKDGKASPSIRGRVTEDARFGIFGVDPLPGLGGVTITAAGNGLKRSARTDGAGFYALENVPVGKYLVTPLLRPYVASAWKSREIEVPVTGCGAADFDMTASGSIEGILLDSQRQPAANVRVEVLRLNAEGKPIYYAQKQTTTDRGGHYRFTGLPRGSFQVGVNVFKAPDAELPYPPTWWSAATNSSIHLNPGESKSIQPFQLPPRLAIRTIEAVVHWPDGRAAQEATLWAEFGDRAAASGETNGEGVARIKVLEDLTYNIEAKIWTGSKGHLEVARSGSLMLKPSKEPIHLELILSQRTEGYQ